MSEERLYFDPNIQLQPCCRAYFLVKQFVPDTRDLFDMAILLSLSSCQCFDQVEQQAKKEEAQCFHQLLKSKARKEYEMTYSNERLLNERFRQFVLNFKYAYEGENTKKKQINSKNAMDGSKYNLEGTYIWYQLAIIVKMLHFLRPFIQRLSRAV